ncbi:glycosyltransferase family 4 protein [Neobacillus drentensis]|uniref:glycosyltransferase family 4 protein n=1 Tax=Neobacillus drentensis TaxID=220684 RepID=UPI000825B451|nr:glycosyltransferase family 4 protein [Neobacillus drentensis]
MGKDLLLVGPISQKLGGVATHIKILEQCFINTGYDVRLHDISDNNKNNLLKKIREIKKIIDLRKISKKNPDSIIHLNPSIYLGSLFKLLIMLTLINNKNIIVQYHGGCFSSLSFFRNPLFKFLFNIINKKPRKIIFLSNSQKNAYSSLFPATTDKIRVIPNFIDIKPDDKVRKNTEVTNILFLSRLVKEKGIMEFLDAAKYLKEKALLENGKVKFQIIGDGPASVEVRDYIRENKIEDIVDFLGPKFGVEKEQYLKSAHIFILPTSWKEGVPYSVLEAMKYSVAVLCTDIGGLSDIIIDGSNGFFITKDSQDICIKLENLIQNPRKVREIGEGGFNYTLDKLSYEQALRTFINIYS